MKQVLDYVVNHPEVAVAAAAFAESAVMPFVPVKWNGLAVALFNFFKRKPVEK